MSLKKLVSVLMFTVVAVAVSVRAQTPDPLVGAWKLDVAKSKFSPGPAAKSSSATFSAAGAAIKAVIDTESGTGEKSHWEYTAGFDGKEVKIVGTNPDADAISVTRTSARVSVSVYKKGGKTTLTNTRTVSADGKTLTVAQKGTNAKGETVNNSLVYTKG